MHLSAFRVLNFWKFCSKFAVGFFRDADLLGMGDGGDGGLSSLHAQDSEGEQAALFLGKCSLANVNSSLEYILIYVRPR